MTVTVTVTVTVSRILKHALRQETSQVKLLYTWLKSNHTFLVKFAYTKKCHFCAYIGTVKMSILLSAAVMCYHCRLCAALGGWHVCSLALDHKNVIFAECSHPVTVTVIHT